MFNLEHFFKKDNLSKDELAQMLKTTPEALTAFEQAYADNVLHQAPVDFFEVNSRQMAEHMMADKPDSSVPDELTDRIVNEFLAETRIWKYQRPVDGMPNSVCICNDFDKFDIQVSQHVTRQEIESLPVESRPQCTSQLQQRDIGPLSYPMLLMNLKESQNPKYDARRRQQHYHLFRQGLDILDIDPVMYEIIGTNSISIGYWLPKIVNAVDMQKFFKIPSTTIIKVPMNILQLTRIEYQMLSRTTLDIVDRFCYKAFGLQDDGDYFIKTGTYSSKFDFRNCRVHDPKEIKELGEYLLFIHSQACQMAGGLNVGKDGTPRSIYGVSTTNEWCVREYIKDIENNPCIYKGLPLHTEYRIFVDFDTDTVLSCVPYWNPETMKKRFGEGADESLHDKHDYVIYKTYEEKLMHRYNENKELIVDNICTLLPDIELKGQWSIDIMQNGSDFWIIDMATAQTSAFYDSVPSNLRHPTQENWLPDLSALLQI